MSPFQTQLLRDADLCVKCGLCLPHCPTYRLSQQEGDGPRGRIALWQGLASGQLALTAKTEAHLNGCVACGRCEAVCPAHVPYARLRNTGRALLQSRRRALNLRARFVATWAANVWVQRSLFVLRWLYRRSGVQGLLSGRRL